MEYLEWAFWGLNGLVSLYGIYHWSRLWNPNGVWGLLTPAAWMWIWQALGVGLVPFVGWSPWHLLWWFPLGWIVCTALGRALALGHELDQRKGMQMGFIRTLAVRGYSKELKDMIDGLSKLSTEQIARLLVMAVWDRAILNIEGNLPVVKNEDGSLDPELRAYPILLKEIEKWISILNKKGLKGRAVCYSIWVHTLRSILRPELSDLANSMWDILMRSKSNWENILVESRDEDIQRGRSSDEVLITETYARAILNCLPPKQLADRRSPH